MSHASMHLSTVGTSSLEAGVFLDDWAGGGGWRGDITDIIIEGLSLLQSIPPTTADKQTQAQKRRGSRSRKLLGAKARSYRLKTKVGW